SQPSTLFCAICARATCSGVAWKTSTSTCCWRATACTPVISCSKKRPEMKVVIKPIARRPGIPFSPAQRDANPKLPAFAACPAGDAEKGWRGEIGQRLLPRLADHHARKSHATGDVGADENPGFPCACNLHIVKLNSVDGIAAFQLNT